MLFALECAEETLCRRRVRPGSLRSTEKNVFVKAGKHSGTLNKGTQHPIDPHEFGADVLSLPGSFGKSVDAAAYGCQFRRTPFAQTSHGSCSCGRLTREKLGSIPVKVEQDCKLRIDPARFFRGARDGDLQLMRTPMSTLSFKIRPADFAFCELSQSEHRSKAGELP